MMTIDSLNLSRLDLIKIDVEGMELEVLQGAEATLGRFRPIIIVEQLKASKQEITTVLASYRLRIVHARIEFPCCAPQRSDAAGHQCRAARGNCNV